jgi:hypothetical protein
MGFTIEKKALIINRFFERWATNKTTVYRKYNYRYLNQDKRLDKTKDEVAVLIGFLFDHLVFVLVTLAFTGNISRFAILGTIKKI